jgi:hypothetical protein
VVRRAYQLDPREGVREVVARLASDQSRDQLMDVAKSLRENVFENIVYGLLQGAMYQWLADSRNQSIAGPVSVNRILSPSHDGYPLRRTYLVTVNREPGGVVAEIREVSPIIALRGRGAELSLALDDLFRCFDRLVRENHFIPPHVRKPQNERIDAILNHMVDWEQFERENPMSQGLWGQVVSHLPRGRVKVRWLNGPDGIANRSTVLSGRWAHPALQQLKEGQWFHATVKQYVDRLEWVEEPYLVPDPYDQRAREEVWQAIPTVRADQPGAWPVQGR